MDAGNHVSKHVVVTRAVVVVVVVVVAVAMGVAVVLTLFYCCRQRF